RHGGDRAMAEKVGRAAKKNPGGKLPRPEPNSRGKSPPWEATCLVLPSECYETFGRVAAEAFAAGTPVIAADIGAISELVDDGRTGYLFRPGDSDDLVRQVRRTVGDAALLAWMRSAARAEFLTKYSA